MEQILIKAAQFLLSLSILIIFHELGHFAFARLFKTRVEKFYLFFNPWFSLFKIKKGETEYGVGWLPLGGYVKISGMIDESMDKEAMKLPPKEWEFRSKKTYQRLLIMVAGVLVNFIFAIIIYIGVLYAWGEQYLPTENAKFGIVANETLEEIGLETGDRILSVDNEYVESFSKIIPTVILDEARSIQVDRKGKLVDIKITEEDIALLISRKDFDFMPRRLFKVQVGRVLKGTPSEASGLKKNDRLLKVDGLEFEFFDEFSSYLKDQKEIQLEVLRNGEIVTIQTNVLDNGTIGFQAVFLEGANDFLELKTIKYGFFESIPAGITRGVNTIKDYLKQFKLIFSPKTKAYESLGGFITIGSIFPGSWNWHAFWNMTAFLSIVLAIMNLLPIPALDGGHVAFLIWEMITGKRPGDKFLEYAQITGMIILLSLVLFANANDIIKLFNK